MKVTQEKLPASKIGLEIEIPADLSKNTYEKVIQELARSSNIPGFRKGKVPRPILIQRLGSARIKAAALDDLINESLQEAIEQESLKTIGNYRLTSNFEDLINQYQPGQPLTFKAEVDVPPVVKLGKYTDLSVQAEEVVYNPADVDQVLESYRNRLATFVPVENRAVQMGDIAVIDFQGRKPATEGEEGELLPGVEGKDYQLELVEGKFIQGFVEGIVGMNPSETKQIELTFPEDYPQKDLAGLPVVFAITLKELKEKELPELDDDFAEEVSEFETIAQLRESLEKQYQEKAAKATKANIHSAILEELLNHTSVDLPETMIQEEMQNLLVQTAVQMQNYGLDISQLFTKENIPEMRERTRPEAVKNVQISLIMEQIAKQESITVEPELIEERINKVKENARKQKQELDEEKLDKMVKEELLMEKTLDWLQERTKVELVPEGTLNPPETEQTEEEESVD
jgi:trigger factor